MGTLSGQLLAINQKQRGHSKTFWFWLSIASVITLVAGVAGYYALIAATQLAVAALPISIDENIGNMAIKSVDLHARLDAGNAATKLVNEIVKELEPHSATKGLNFKVMVVDEPTVNAFALPGGQIVVYTGLMKKAKSAEQLAGVIAHEMAHATLRHGLKGVGQSLGIVAAIQLVTGDVGGLLALSSQLAQESILTSYSRKSETEADLEGARMLHEAGIDPKNMADFFQMLEQNEGDIPDMLAWISTHPQHADRIAKINDYQKQIPQKPYRLLELPWEEVQNQLGN
jgi:predicted Zn-dependent protease